MKAVRRTWTVVLLSTLLAAVLGAGCTAFEPMIDAIGSALPFLLDGDDERFQTEVMRLAPAPKHDPKQAAKRGEG